MNIILEKSTGQAPGGSGLKTAGPGQRPHSALVREASATTRGKWRMPWMLRPLRVLRISECGVLGPTKDIHITSKAQRASWEKDRTTVRPIPGRGYESTT